MFMTKYDFYDIYAVFIYIRAYTDDAKNAEIAKAVKKLLDLPEKERSGLNCIRKAISAIDGVDREHYYWAFTENVYTYIPPMIKEDMLYRVLSAGFSEIISAIESGDSERVYRAADAMHNVPIILAENNITEAKKHIKRETKYYRKEYNNEFLNWI